MGSKRNAFRKRSKHNNVLQINQYQIEKQKDVQIIPRNKNQESYLIKLLDPAKDIVFGVGPAGTGKTLLAVQVAIKMFKERQVDRIIITRPAVSVDEDIGFLPGTLEEKMAPWTRPIFDVFQEYFRTQDLRNMLYEGVVEIAPLAFMRGRNFVKAFIVADECQNTTQSQMKMLLTRLSAGSKMAVTGDLNQADRQHNNGLLDFIEKLNRQNVANRIDVVTFHKGDIERHPAVREVLDIYGD